jgi:hypothetical protein
MNLNHQDSFLQIFQSLLVLEKMLNRPHPFQHVNHLLHQKSCYLIHLKIACFHLPELLQLVVDLLPDQDLDHPGLLLDLVP